MTAVDTPETRQDTRVGRSIGRLVKLWAAAIGIAVLLVISAYLIAQDVADPLVVAGAGEVTLGNVVGFTMLGATIGAVLATGLARFSRRPRPVFVAATVIALAGYAVVPFTAAESVETALWLNLFHLVVAVPVIGILARWLPGDRNPLEA